jgi:nitrite reductase (NADH) large subunit
MEQGRVAGLCMAGKEANYAGTVPSNTLKVVGLDLVAAGEIDADGKMESVVKADNAKNIYRKIVLRDNVIIGAILFGNISGSEEIQQAIKTQKNVGAFKHELADETFAFSRLQ